MTDDDLLWARFADNPNDMGLLAIIADHYRDSGNDEYADCLAWCAENKRMPFEDSPKKNWIWYSAPDWDSTTLYNSEAFLPCGWGRHFYGTMPIWNRDRKEWHWGTSSIPDAYLLLCRHWYAVMGVPVA